MNILQQPYLHRPHSLVTVLGEGWDDTHKSISVIKFVCLLTLMRLFLLVADASRRLCCFFSLFVLHLWYGAVSYSTLKHYQKL